MSERERTVVVAMSGGVDSSVAAGLLREAGHRVIGVTLVLQPCGEDGEVEWCCGADGQAHARDVAATLDIPYYPVHCSAEFEKNVLGPSWREYARGRTPNPCLRCNAALKFGTLLELARKLGASKVATGHYARVQTADADDGPRLLRGADATKDQSYFLYTLSRTQLEGACFPLGSLTKAAVRRIAARMKLSTADRPESQDACFTPVGGGFAEGLRRRFGATSTPGDVVDTAGNVLGRHAGIHHFTIGQRKGIGIATGRRTWVVRLDAERARVVVSDDPQQVNAPGLIATDVTWTGGAHVELPSRCEAQIRYRHPPARAALTDRRDGRVTVRFDEPQRAVAPGQAVVFYHEARVLGGGTIAERLAR